MKTDQETEPHDRLFEITAFELYSGIKNTIRDEIRRVVTDLGRRQLAGPVTSMVFELADNALKALYRHVFYKNAIAETGLGDLPYDAWLKVFRDEIETNSARNFERICRQRSLAVVVRLTQLDEALRIEVINDGVPDKSEHEYLRNLLKKSASAHNIQAFVDAENIDIVDTEKPGLGWTLIFLTLRGMGLTSSQFHFIIGHNQTTARIDLPLSVFRTTSEAAVKVVDPGKVADELFSRVANTLNFGIVIFDRKGDLLEVSRAVLDQVGLKPEQVAEFPEPLKARFIEDVFSGPFNVASVYHFENYRLKVESKDGRKEVLFNISGILNRETQRVETIWQTINLEQDIKTLSEGSVFENIHIQSIVRPYIPNMILEKAHETLRHGLFKLPNEHKELTIMFLDLIGFTSKSEHLDPAGVIDLLNLAMGIAVKSIEVHHGFIDKFLGDGIMAIFSDPLEVVVAGFEIQNNFKGVNEYRQVNDEEAIEMRIGINTGMVILGSVGTKRRMDWTALGDVVNTASRIEKASRANSVLISEATLEKIRDHVTVAESFSQKVKGKQQEIMLHFLKSVDYASAGQKRRLEL
ncbi:MAG TPA: adenylate/guanylate cyclase domain-containing protein [Turneriella sp.]|nr:adenylate/guanylate cyclase domain-containing protein [Turneriella sp.]